MLERELAAMLRGPARVNVLVSLREDALAKLDRFKGSIPGILDNYLRLDRLSREAARAAVEQPLARWHELGGDAMTIEPELVDAVLDQVVAGRIRGGLGGRGSVGDESVEERIEAPYLQLVMERLWGVEREEGSTTLRATTLGQLGGAAQIVAAHLERAMAALTPAQQEIASALFRQLVTPSGAKIAHATSDLAGYADAPEDEVVGVLDALAAGRILRPGDNGSYEIYHDVLAAPILGWRARHVQAAALVAAHRRSRRLALVATAAVAGLVITALVAVFALVQRSNARSDARDAQARELDAVAVSLLPTDPELGLYLARNSAVLSPTPTAEKVLRQALNASRLRGVVDVGKPLLAAAANEGGVVTAATDGSVLVAGANGSKRRPPPGCRRSMRRPRGEATCSSPAGIRACGSSPATRCALSRRSRVRVGRRCRPTGRSRQSGRPGATCAVVDLRTGQVLVAVDHGAPSDGCCSRERRAASCSPRAGARSGRPRSAHVQRRPAVLRVRRGMSGQITAIRLQSARESASSSASADGEGRVWQEARADSPVSVLSGHSNYLTDMAVQATDGTQVTTASRDRTARTWKAKTGGSALATFAGDTEAVVSAQFTPSGDEVVTASEDGTARTWYSVRTAGVAGRRGSRRTRHAARVRRPWQCASRSRRRPEGTRTGSCSRVAQRSSLGPTAAPSPGTVTGPGGQQASIDGSTVTVTRGDGTTFELSGHRARVTSVAFSADGARIVTASADHDARIWDARTAR